MTEEFFDIEDHYKDLVIKVLSDEVSRKEMEVLKEWLSQSDVNLKYLNQMHSMWQLSSDVHKVQSF